MGALVGGIVVLIAAVLCLGCVVYNNNIKKRAELVYEDYTQGNIQYTDAVAQVNDYILKAFLFSDDIQ